MKEPAQRVRGVRFGVFELDLGSGELRKQGVKVKLQEQPFQVVAILLEHAGEVVTREELRQRLWPEDTFVDFEHGLATAINKARDALGDAAQNPRFIETLPRRGYRFIAPVEPLPSGTSPAAEQGVGTKQAAVAAVYDRRPESADAAAAGASPARPGRPRWAHLSRPRLVASIAGAFVVTFAILAAFNVGGLRRRMMSSAGPGPALPLPRIGSIAVLPLENLSSNPGQDYFADGMTDELIATLGRIQSLRIISRTSVQRYKKTNETLPQIARELNVDAILEGTVMHADGRVRITAELVSAADRELWANSFESGERNVLALQDEIAQAIADAITVKLQPNDQARLAAASTIEPEAHDAYLEALFYYYRAGEDLPKAIRYVKRAIQLSPNYAEAYALLAACYYDSSQSRWGNIPNSEAAQMAKATALKALKLNGSLAEPHRVLGSVAEGQDWNWADAETEFKRAMELDPSLESAQLAYAWHLVFMGHADEAVQVANRAAELDPVSPYTLSAQGLVLFYTRHYGQAIEEAKKGLETFPDNPTLYDILVRSYESKGIYGKAVAALQEEMRLEGEKRADVAALGKAFKAAGIRGVWRWQLDRLNAKRRAEKWVNPYLLAENYSLLGEKNKAFESLGKVYAQRGQDMLFVKINPCFDDLRSDPRFQKLMARMNFPQ